MATGTTPSLPRLRDLVVRPIVAVAPSASLVEVARSLREHDIGCLVVAEPGGRVAVLTERDVTAAVAAGRDLDAAAGTLAGADPPSLPEDTSALDAALAMLRSGGHHVIVTRDNRATGVVSGRDIMAALAEAVVPERLFLIAVRRTPGGR